MLLALFQGPDEIHLLSFLGVVGGHGGGGRIKFKRYENENRCVEGRGWWEWRNRKPSRRWQDLRPAPPQTPAPSLPGGPASQSGAKRGVASLGRETSLGRLNPDFFNKLPLIVRAWGGVAALAVGRRRGRPVTASGRRVQTWFLCRHRKRLPRAAGSPPGRRGQGRARPGYAEPAGRGPAAGRHGGCGRRSVAIHHPGPPEAGWSGAAPPRPVRSAGGGLMLSPRPEVLRSPGTGSVPRGREPSFFWRLFPCCPPARTCDAAGPSLGRSICLYVGCGTERGGRCLVTNERCSQKAACRSCSGTVRRESPEEEPGGPRRST